MVRSGNNRAVQKNPEVTFRIKLRPATYEQLEAGKRLFSRLISKAQTGEHGAGGPAEAAARAKGEK
jgi:hypothetical protein